MHGRVKSAVIPPSGCTMLETSPRSGRRLNLGSHTATRSDRATSHSLALTNQETNPAGSPASAACGALTDATRFVTLLAEATLLTFARILEQASLSRQHVREKEPCDAPMASSGKATPYPVSNDAVSGTLLQPHLLKSSSACMSYCLTTHANS